jgi:cell wall-associated NlpC family hydrolase
VSTVTAALAATLVLASVLMVGTAALSVLSSASPLAAAPSAAAEAGIPAPYLADSMAAGARFGVPWPVVAGIYRVECDFGRARLDGCIRGTANPAGAQGPGQFLPGTWRAGLGPHELIPPGPPTVAGFATDGDGDGVADPWDPADATASTARLLAADGGGADIAGAVYAYNHSWSYVRRVLALAASYTASAVSGSGASVAAVLSFAEAQLGDPYRWGGAGPGAWDCSGLVMAAYARAGVVLAHNAEQQYRQTAARVVSLGALQPGDLVFFGADPSSIGHVGIYLGDDDMIDAPHTGAFVRVEPITWPDLLVATRPLV